MGRLPEAGRETPCCFCCFLGYPEHNPHLARSYPWGHLASPTRWEAAVFYYREQVPTETAPRDVVLTWQISDRCPGSSILPPGPPWGRGGWRTGLPPLPAWFPTEPVVLLYPFCGSYPCVSVVLVIQNALVACGGGGSGGLEAMCFGELDLCFGLSPQRLGLSLQGPLGCGEWQHPLTHLGDACFLLWTFPGL